MNKKVKEMRDVAWMVENNTLDRLLTFEMLLTKFIKNPEIPIKEKSEPYKVLKEIQVKQQQILDCKVAL